MSLSIGVLGALDVRHDGEARPVPAGRLGTFLAAMALRANRVVPLPELIEELWGASPPRSASFNVRSYASQSRRVLGATGRLVARGGGYLLSTGPGEVDADVFESIVDDVGAADPPQVCVLLDKALSLWRGPVAADVAAGPLIGARAGALEEMRVVAVEELAAALLETGAAHPAEVAARLRQHLADHPYRERAWSQLMLALHRAGDPAAALEAYATAGRILADDLGVAPGPDLEAVYRAVRDRDGAAAVRRDGAAVVGRDGTAATGRDRAAVGSRDEAAPVARDGATAREVPHQLPRASPWFTGRDAELARVCAALRADGAPAVVVTGPPAAGKSALALVAAHRVATDFPDGQLYVDLSTMDGPADVLARFLRALGEPAGAAVDAAAFRTAAYGRRLLVVLDNADGFVGLEQLMPTGAGCAALLTRRSVPVRPASVPVDVGPLPVADATDLLVRIAGPPRDAADRAAIDVIVEHCEGLPTAVRAAATRLARRPDRPASVLAARLRPHRFRLDELRCDSLGLRGHYARACRTLPETTALHRLALLRAPLFRLPVLAALLGLPVHEADAVLDLLVGEHLVEPLADGRFRLPGLLRAYALELADAEPAAQRTAALLRAFRWYAAAAEHVVASGADPGPWFDIERENLVAVVRQATRVPGGASAVTRIVGALDGFLRRLDDPQARLLRRLGARVT